MSYIFSSNKLLERNKLGICMGITETLSFGIGVIGIATAIYQAAIIRGNKIEPNLSGMSTDRVTPITPPQS